MRGVRRRRAARQRRMGGARSRCDACNGGRGRSDMSGFCCGVGHAGMPGAVQHGLKQRGVLLEACAHACCQRHMRMNACVPV
eukprot:351813-Chlamydomonas_euryale.AAC.1